MKSIYGCDLKKEVKAKKPYRKYPEKVKILDEKNMPIFLMEFKAI
jgi:hypothetical protein